MLLSGLQPQEQARCSSRLSLLSERKCDSLTDESLKSSTPVSNVVEMC